ncbi:odorant receptor 9a-like [Cylas formicarius]|uniref:odorant receptor 9a-like n=1 Tax=Cylas formicarius TaxID=197179 RepID=UPI00295843DD|nr:odorant receptor 9a-like [Cylas formicarius]
MAAAPKRRSILSISKIFLLSVGMWKLELPFRHPAAVKFYSVFSKLMPGYFAMLALSMSVQFAITLTTNFSNPDLFKHLSFVIIIGTAYYVTLVIRSDGFVELISRVEREEKRLARSEVAEILLSHLKVIRFSNAVGTTFLALSICTGAALIWENFWSNMKVLNYNKKYNTSLVRPILIDLYFFNLNKRKHETLMLIVTEIMLVINTHVVSSTKVIVYTCIMFAASALRCLQIRFRKLGLRQEDALADLKLLIQEHQEVIEFVENLNKSIKYLLLFEYFLHSLNVAAVSVQVLTYDSKMLMRPACYLTFVLVQVFILGLVTDEIKVESLALSDALYDSPWYNQNKTCRKMLRIVMIRAQRPLELTIGPFNPMTMESALAILKASYSYVTLISQNAQ